LRAASKEFERERVDREASSSRDGDEKGNMLGKGGVEFCLGIEETKRAKIRGTGDTRRSTDSRHVRG
jgi:hypothetical protein